MCFNLNKTLKKTILYINARIFKYVKIFYSSCKYIQDSRFFKNFVQNLKIFQNIQNSRFYYTFLA